MVIKVLSNTMASSILIESVRIGDECDIIYALGRQHQDPSYNDNYCIKLAVSKNHVRAVELLMAATGTDPTIDNNNLFYFAVQEGYIDIVRMFLNDNRFVLRIIQQFFMQFNIGAMKYLNCYYPICDLIQQTITTAQ